MNEAFFLYIKAYPLWEQVEKAIKSQRPIIPPHDPNNDNTEVWKNRSAQQQGFDLCCSFFNIKE
jgi:hypothetical protein